MDRGELDRFFAYSISDMNNQLELTPMQNVAEVDVIAEENSGQHTT